MSPFDYIRFIASLAFVLALLLGAAYALRRWGHKVPGLISLGSANQDGRLAIIASLPLDPRRKLILIRRDTTEHLLLLGPEGATVVETAISKQAS